MTDRESAGLRGPVAFCETESNQGQVQGESFDSEGQRIELWYGSPRGDSTSQWHYDPNGRMITEKHTGFADQTRTYEYDNAGRLIRVRTHLPSGIRHVDESWLYHDDGSSTVTQYTDLRVPRMEVAVCVDATLHHSQDTVRITIKRDPSGNPVQKLLYDIDMRIIREILFRYDEGGRLVEEGEADHVGVIRDDMRNLYRYDAQGRTVAIERRYYFGGGRREFISYNNRGDIEERRISTLPGGIELDGFFGTENWSQFYTYEYDSRNNWTMRTEYVRTNDSDEPTHTAWMRRRLLYWDSTPQL